MRKILLLSILFAVAQISHPRGAFSAPPQTEPTAEVRGGEGFRAGGGGQWHEGGDRRGAPGGEFREGGERGEYGEGGERGEFREPEQELPEDSRGNVIIGPGYGYYPYYNPFGYYPPFPSYEEAPEYEEPDYLLYCDDPPGYYPNVVQCNDDWEEVPR